jgi:hypothetical protein
MQIWYQLYPISNQLRFDSISIRLAPPVMFLLLLVLLLLLLLILLLFNLFNLFFSLYHRLYHPIRSIVDCVVLEWIPEVTRGLVLVLLFVQVQVQVQVKFDRSINRYIVIHESINQMKSHH